MQAEDAARETEVQAQLKIAEAETGADLKIAEAQRRVRKDFADAEERAKSAEQRARDAEEAVAEAERRAANAEKRCAQTEKLLIAYKLVLDDKGRSSPEPENRGVGASVLDEATIDAPRCRWSRSSTLSREDDDKPGMT
ncbi:hypothetical protein A1Q1_00598 [Trichosporon asahii var. asahii CBS 2479]|uniref:Uncharacterized protein n=1 Tax=Trichosporon asahii var. asahii (strain ATCC 90039 / CBS 2479 / JCM 2466 / KCTC 7840 / NBRC 103889/ NCYC 2677 / UAMH 7654) TaxID=1186058 RepID=J5TBI7_TRIAS|nr:hypothetical protein A1Q1_00598 [Trichosporon asahii var. asahii CBS 2479]EJT50131.1 hypothetical protein A1Q1_00598 [Trichosporon asahii var. asahii CBS 2479]